MKSAHFGHGFPDGLMLDDNAVSRNHGSRAVCTTLTMDENLSVRIIPDHIEELHDLSVGREYNFSSFHGLLDYAGVFKIRSLGARGRLSDSALRRPLAVLLLGFDPLRASLHL